MLELAINDLYSACIVKERFEKVIMFPHFRSLETQLNLGRARHADTHNLVEIISSRLCRGKWVSIQDCNV